VTEALYRAGITPHYAPTSPATAGASCCAIPGRCAIASTRAAGAPGAELHPAARAAWTTDEAYGTLNMGAGFAAVRAGRRRHARRGRDRAGSAAATLAGVVEAGDKELLIEPLGLRYAADDLQLR
jgi:phosphoribosylformylglycinamidine cyclo-ligase